MKRNRKGTKHTVFKAGSVSVVSLIVSGFVMLMVYWSIDSRCTAIAREIGKAEKRLAALESEYVRETARWDELKTPDRLSEMLLRSGLEMKYARQDQVVRMTPDGRPVPGQIAVTRARQKLRGGMVAQTVPSADSSLRPVAPSKRRVIRR